MSKVLDIKGKYRRGPTCKECLCEKWIFKPRSKQKVRYSQK